jgi:MoxR-vWA-beta-propeller ternary system domain bpX2
MMVFAFHLPDAPSLAPHRTRAGWSACVENNALWLRCPDADAAECAALPAVARYRSDARGLLTPLEGTVPVAQAPAGPWLPLTEIFAVQSATPNYPGRTRQRLDISLVRTEREQPAQALLLPLAELLPWVELAPRIRLERLQFAAAADGCAFVKGTPLPPVPGAAFYFAGAMALPCGWDFAPHLWHGWVEKALAIPAGGLCLVQEDVRLELIGAEGFAPLTLAAVRRTLAALTTAP